MSLTDDQIKAGIAAANAMDSTFDYGDGSTAAEREAACMEAFRQAAGLPAWESYQLEGVGMVRRRKAAVGVQATADAESSVREQTLAGLVKRLAWLVPKDHAARVVATEYLQRLGYLSPLRSDDSGVMLCQACAGDAPGGKCQTPKCVGGPIVQEIPANP